MKKNINFFHAAKLAIAYLKKYEYGVGECCHYCGSVLIKVLDGVDDGNEYHSNHKCMNCGATAKITEIWSRS